MYNLNNLGKKIADARKAHGLTQEQLAKELSVTAQAVSKWELGVGYPDISIIPHIAQVLNIPIDRLFGYCDGFEECYQGLPFVTSYRGVACYSDKEVRSIGSDGIVFFTDNSAANLQGRTADNYGKGEIRFLSKEARATGGRAVPGDIERTFASVDGFLIELYSTDVIRFVQRADDTTVITAKGSSDFIDSLSISSSGRRVIIKQDRRTPGEEQESGVIEIHTRGGHQTLTMDLYRQTECEVGCDFREVGLKVMGWADISCRETGWLGLAVMRGDCNFTCTGADKADIWLHNNASVEIGKVRGNMHLEARGENSVTVGEGNIQNLYALLRGTGSLCADGLRVGRAEIHANGEFDITLGAILKSSFEAMRGNVNYTVLSRGEG